MWGSHTVRLTCSGVSGSLGITPGIEAAVRGGVAGRSLIVRLVLYRDDFKSPVLGECRSLAEIQGEEIISGSGVEL